MKYLSAVVGLLLANTEQEVFVVMPIRSISAALSDFSLSPKVERSGKTPFILTIDDCAIIVSYEIY
jgi:hypothetical protein